MRVAGVKVVGVKEAGRERLQFVASARVPFPNPDLSQQVRHCGFGGVGGVSLGIELLGLRVPSFEREGAGSRARGG